MVGIKQPRPIHPFPARMAASIPWELLRDSASGEPLQVLDPMAGSGTTLVTARMLGHQAIGFDTDPLAVLMSSTWCSDASHSAVLNACARVLRGAAGWRSLPLRSAYPAHADSEDRAFVRYWFDPVNRRQLAALAREIANVTPEGVRQWLWCALSRLIVVKQAGASLAKDVAHSRPHKSFSVAPLRPLDHFELALAKILAAAPFAESKSASPAARVSSGDARSLPLPSQSIDIVLTSPPYLNAIDYLRGHRMSLIWMGHSVRSLRAIRTANIGTEAGRLDKPDDAVLAAAYGAGTRSAELTPSDRGMFTRYIRDMRVALGEMRRVMKDGAVAVLVVGDCNLRGTFVRNSAALKVVANAHGLRLTSETRRDLPPGRRYLPPPQARGAGADFSKRMRREVVLTFSR
jgi:hypothetical protein